MWCVPFRSSNPQVVHLWHTHTRKEPYSIKYGVGWAQMSSPGIKPFLSNLLHVTLLTWLLQLSNELFFKLFAFLCVVPKSVLYLICPYTILICALLCMKQKCKERDSIITTAVILVVPYKWGVQKSCHTLVKNPISDLEGSRFLFRIQWSFCKFGYY